MGWGRGEGRQAEKGPFSIESVRGRKPFLHTHAATQLPVRNPSLCCSSPALKPGVSITESGPSLGPKPWLRMMTLTDRKARDPKAPVFFPINSRVSTVLGVLTRAAGSVLAGARRQGAALNLTDTSSLPRYPGSPGRVIRATAGRLVNESQPAGEQKERRMERRKGRGRKGRR